MKPAQHPEQLGLAQFQSHLCHEVYKTYTTEVKTLPFFLINEFGFRTQEEMPLSLLLNFAMRHFRRMPFPSQPGTIHMNNIYSAIELQPKILFLHWPGMIRMTSLPIPRT